MSKVHIAVLALLLATTLSSCATVINGTHQRVPISSSPTGAEVDIDGYYVGSTPTTVSITRKDSHLITLTKQGYEESVVRLNPQLSAAVAGNIIAGGFVGWGVDAVTGSQYYLAPETVDVNLQPAGYWCPYQQQ